MEEIGTNFLQFVPVLEPRCTTPIILANDPEIRGFDSSKYVFTDLSFGLGVQVENVQLCFFFQICLWSLNKYDLYYRCVQLLCVKQTVRYGVQHQKNEIE